MPQYKVGDTYKPDQGPHKGHTVTVTKVDYEESSDFISENPKDYEYVYVTCSCKAYWAFNTDTEDE